MQWQDILIKVLIGIACTILSGLLSWVMVKLKSLISTKIKNEKAKELLTAALDTISAVTKATQQTIVDNLKKTNKWAEADKEKILNDAIKAAKEQMSTEIKNYIQENCGGDIDAWCKTQIEALLHDIKLQAT